MKPGIRMVTLCIRSRRVYVGRMVGCRRWAMMNADEKKEGQVSSFCLRYYDLTQIWSSQNNSF